MSRVDDILDAEETIPTIDRDTIMRQVVQNLEQVYDPEMPSVSVIHLGLIYDIEILENNTLVKITHTLTSAFCPAADSMPKEIQQKIAEKMMELGAW